MEKSVFVTGGTGFVGKNLIPKLIANGFRVKALARSQSAANKISELGALPILGDLNDINALKSGVDCCFLVLHLAASVDFFASENDLKKIHVDATELLLKLAKVAKVEKFIYLGAASVIMNGKPIFNADESFISNNLKDGYSRTKLQAENLVLNAHDKSFQTTSIRPPLIWGSGDPNTLPAIIQAIHKKQFLFINGGRHQFVTCHVSNVCHALILACNSSLTGSSYFITDGERPLFRDFMIQYVGTQEVIIKEKSISLSIARIVACIVEFVWKFGKLKGHPPIYGGLVSTLGIPFTTNDSKARKDLGYQPIISINQGMKEMYYDNLESLN